MNIPQRTNRKRKRLSLKFGPETPDRLAFTEDISPEGMFIKTAYICKPGSTVLIEIILPDNTSATLEGKVMWAKKVQPNMIRLVTKCGMGIRIMRYVSGEENYRRLYEELHDR